MATISRLTTWSVGDTLTAAALNAEFNNIVNDYNGNIANANISASAAIAYSKLSLTGSVTNADLAGSIAASKISDTAVTLTATQSMSNKTLTSPTISGTVGGSATYTKPTLNGSVSALTSDTDGATITFDMAASNTHTVTLAGNRTLALSNVSVGQSFKLRLQQDGTGSRTVTWFSTIKWAGGAAPTLTTTGGSADWFSFICTASNQFDGAVIGQDFR